MNETISNNNILAEELQKKRKQKGYTVPEVAGLLRIPPGKIRDIEEWNLPEPSERFYFFGFLKLYAEFLGIEADTESMMNESYQKTMMTDNEKIISGGVEKIIPEKKKQSLARLSFLFLILLITVYVFFPVITENCSKKLRCFQSHAITVMEDDLPAQCDPVVLNTPENTEIELKAVAVNDTWVRIYCDNALKYEKVLKKGTTEYWKAEDTIEVKVGYIPGVQMYSRTSPESEFRKVEIENTGSYIGRLKLTDEFSK